MPEGESTSRKGTDGQAIAQEPRGSSTEAIYRALRREIVTLRLVPGSRISDKAISERFSCSRTPVREAILRLTDEGMIVIRPHAGTFVTYIQPAALRNAHFIRSALECAALAEARPMTQGDQRRLRRLLRSQDAAIEDASPDRFYQLDDEFHETLMTLSGHDEAWPTANRAKAQIDRVRYLAISDLERKRKVLEQHKRIVAPIEDGDPLAAAEFLKAHLDDSFATLMSTMDMYRSYFE